MKVRDLIRIAFTEWDCWQIAIRPRESVPLYQGNGAGFALVPNSFRYWRADPFLWKYQDDNYLFVEMYDRLKRKGVIGVSKITDGMCGKFHICLTLPFHLSYPCVFTCGEKTYMLPECYQSEEIALYRCTRFPSHWEKDSIISDCVAADTTPLCMGVPKTWKQFSFFTTVFPSVSRRINDNMSIISAMGEKPRKAVYSTVSRPAGHFIVVDGRVIRPAQDDTKRYGSSLFFYQVDCCDPSHYSEHTLLRVLPPEHDAAENEICISLRNNQKNTTFSGIHTYNSNDDYEVIDLLINEKKSAGAFFWRIAGMFYRWTERKNGKTKNQYHYSCL